MVEGPDFSRKILHLVLRSTKPPCRRTWSALPFGCEWVAKHMLSGYLFDCCQKSPHVARG